MGWEHVAMMGGDKCIRILVQKPLQKSTWQTKKEMGRQY